MFFQHFACTGWISSNLCAPCQNYSRGLVWERSLWLLWNGKDRWLFSAVACKAHGLRLREAKQMREQGMYLHLALNSMISVAQRYVLVSSNYFKTTQGVEKCRERVCRLGLEGLRSRERVLATQHHTGSPSEAGERPWCLFLALSSLSHKFWQPARKNSVFLLGVYRASKTCLCVQPRRHSLA